ncbi:C-type lectin mannose-binding isoform-like [Diadema setosum]|uniref:C-type lectin mannose-binding isoform-like n=1 Tax=Diadema setosum TaxID=31175 RepID=UPI003B3A7051
MSNYNDPVELTSADHDQLKNYDCEYIFIQGFWIGYNDIRTEGAWVWSDHCTPRAPYTNWRQYQPDNFYGGQDSGRMWYTGNISDTARDWDDGSCGVTGDYICKLTF